MSIIKKINSEASQLIQLSFLMLFVELALIRWTGSNFFYLSFFSNFVMLASFLGIGIGFLRKKTFNLFLLAPIVLASIVYLCHAYSYEYSPHMDPFNIELNYNAAYFKNNLIPTSFTLPVLFIIVTLMMASIAEGVARVFRQFPPVEAYRLDIIGSLLGIVTFSALAFYDASPVWWSAIICALFTLQLARYWQKHYIFAGLQIAAMAVTLYIPTIELSSNHLWSPYYKIGLQAYSDNKYVVTANGLPQQFIESVEQRAKTKPFYFSAYQHKGANTALNRVLVIGAGTGGDVAIALAQGAKHVDAVEIDPMLYQLGSLYNPNHPYQDPRVHRYIDDGRAFLERNNKKYDMIIYALPDSLLLISGQSSLRLENYLFTVEAIQSVYNHLEPNGIFTMYNYYNNKWVVDRLANTLNTVFKHAPCLDTAGKSGHWLSSISISKSVEGLQCQNLWQATKDSTITPATDNHPFFYLKTNTIPAAYVALIFFVMLTTLGAFKVNGISRQSISNHMEFFLMGMAFLLLETKNISYFALLFGSSWMVNALVFTGILFSVYLAIEVANRVIELRHDVLYGLLIVSLLLSWLMPSSYFLHLGVHARFVFATLLAFAPIFIANLIFADHFKNSENSTEAFAANYMGAVMGGLLEYSALIFGYSNLFIIIAVLYTCAVLSMQLKKIASAYDFPSGYLR